MSAETLGEVGDINATPGSREWAIAVRLEIQFGLRNTLSDAANLRNWLHVMERRAGYKALPDPTGQPFLSYRAFCAAKHPWGLGYPPEVIDNLVAERVSAAERARKPATLLDHGGDRKSSAAERARKPATLLDHGGDRTSTDQGSDTTLICARRDADYLTARIARDHPDILAEMTAGKFPSVRAAARKAGIVKARVYVPLDTARAAAVLLRHFNGMDLIAALARAMDATATDEQGAH